jgi:hypothetical protein
MPDATTAPVLSPEKADVISWRCQCLLRAGYTREMASVLAPLLTVDLHQALRLIADGCAPETAARILL